MSRALLVDTEVSPFGRHPDHGLVDCAAAVVAAIRRRHPALTEIDSIWAGSARPGESEGWESGLAAAIAQAAGLGGSPATDVHAFCASSNVAFLHAAREIRSGQSDICLVVGVEHMSGYRRRGPLRPPAMPEWASDLTPPVFYAMCASRYLDDYGLAPDVLADIAVRNRANAVGNPLAKFRAPVERAEVFASRMISEPLTLLQCASPGDGSGAALLVSEAGAERLGIDPVGCTDVVGLGHASNRSPDVAALCSFGEDVTAASEAYTESGVDPAQLDVVEVHDAFTIAQAIHLEDLQIAPRGKGWAVGQDGNGPVVNPSGGLLGRSHPLGATGIAQLDSVRRALAHRPGHGLVHEAGGLQHLGQLLSTVIVLSSIN